MISNRLFILAGEASGDMHAGRLAKAISQQLPNISMEGWGGESMQAAGVHIHKHYRELAFMGFIEVIRNIFAILKNFSIAKKQILSAKPDSLLLVDYPGFNLRMAKWAKKHGIKVIYYISPQIWAWKASRAFQIKKYVDRMICILPFEPDFYAKYGVEAFYTGHPLIERIQEFYQEHGVAETDRTNTIALLPGSRTQEIKAMLPVYLEVVRMNPSLDFIVAMAPSQPDSLYQNILNQVLKDDASAIERVKLSKAGSYKILYQAKAAFVTSGTATLETALLGIPQVVCYSGSRISYEIAKRVIRVKYISLVNLILDEPFLLELIQHDFNPISLDESLHYLLNPAHEEYFAAGYGYLRKLLKTDELPSHHAARLVVQDL
jgi:lipid-A-disaccharide synthase